MCTKVFWAPWISVPNFKATHLVVVGIFQSGPNGGPSKQWITCRITNKAGNFTWQSWSDCLVKVTCWNHDYILQWQWLVLLCFPQRKTKTWKRRRKRMVYTGMELLWWSYSHQYALKVKCCENITCQRQIVQISYCLSSVGDASHLM